MRISLSISLGILTDCFFNGHLMSSVLWGCAQEDSLEEELLSGSNHLFSPFRKQRIRDLPLTLCGAR